MRTYRPLISGAAAPSRANHPLRSGRIVALREGGNAVDAAVATRGARRRRADDAGLGGDGFYHVYEQATGNAVVFNGTGPPLRSACRSAMPGHSAHWTAVGFGPGHPAVDRCTAALAGCLATCSPSYYLAPRGFGATRSYSHFAEEYRRR